jgi:hypothetical protein
VPAHFVLDQNFPLYVTGFQWTRPGLRVSRLSDIDPELTHDQEDWEVLRALHGRADVDGFITNDAKMLNLPTEMLALHTTSLTLVITDGVGDQPIRATGLIMVHLETIVSQMGKKPRIWILKPSPITAKRPWDYLNRIAKYRNVAIDVVVEEERVRVGVAKSAMPTDVSRQP